MKKDIKFDYQLTLIKEKYYFASTSASFNHNSIISLYNDENYLSSGYFGYYNNSIVYLDNDLNVIDIEKNKILEKLNNKEEFVKKRLS